MRPRPNAFLGLFPEDCQMTSAKFHWCQGDNTFTHFEAHQAVLVHQRRGGSCLFFIPTSHRWVVRGLLVCAHKTITQPVHGGQNKWSKVCKTPSATGNQAWAYYPYTKWQHLRFYKVGVGRSGGSKCRALTMYHYHTGPICWMSSPLCPSSFLSISTVTVEQSRNAPKNCL